MPSPSFQEIDAIRKKGLRPQVVGCILHKNKILFVYKEQFNLWQLPQGGIDNKETLDEALMREMEEELGKTFVQSFEPTTILLGEDHVEFAPRLFNARALCLDDGTPVEMRGKHYFFIAIQAQSDELDVKQTEFDQYRWLAYQEAKETANQIYQPGKKRTILRAIDLLHYKDLL